MKRSPETPSAKQLADGPTNSVNEVSRYKDAEEMTPSERWIIAFTVMFGAFMAVMDTSVVNVSMTHMMGSFAEDLSAITWVANAYSIAEIIMVTMSGWWSALIGRKTLFLSSFALFTAGSILCGMATTFEQMIIFRIIQGIGGGALIPVSQAILRETFPKEQQGMAMAMFGMGVVLAPAMGPVLGGWITDVYGWPWIFYINVPFCIVGMFLVMRYVFDPPYMRRGVKSIDWAGITLLSVSLTGMQIVLERGQEEGWFDSKLIVVGTVVTVVSFLALLVWEWYAKEPVVNLRVLKDKNLAIGSTMGLIFGVALFGTTFILPQFTQNLLGYPAFQSGLVLAPRAITLMLFMPVVGWLYKRFSTRELMAVGIVIISWSYYDLTLLSLDAGFWNLTPTLLIMGLGMPFMFVPMSTFSLSTVPKENMTDASSFYTLARRVGGNIGYAAVATMLARGLQIHRAHLSENISALDQVTQTYQATLTAAMRQLGLDPAMASHTALAYMNKILDRQAAMLAYNDISMYFGFIFAAQALFLFFIPGRPGNPVWAYVRHTAQIVMGAVPRLRQS